MKHFSAVAVLSFLASSAFAQTTPEPALKAHLAKLANGTEAEQIESVRAIKAFGPAGVSCVPGLRSAFQESSLGVRTEIAAALAGYGPAAKEAIPELVAAIGQPGVDGRLLREVVRAVAALGEPGNRDVVRVCLADENQGGRAKRVGFVPEYLLLHPAATTPVVTEFLSDPSRGIRVRAAMSLAQMTRTSAPGKPSAFATVPLDVRSRAIAELRKSLEDLDGQVRVWSAAALIDADRTSIREAIPILITLVRKLENYAPGLESLGRTGSDGARLLLDYLDDPAPHVRDILVATMANFGEAGLPTLVNGLHHPSPRVREGSLRAIQRTANGVKARAAVVERMGDADESVRLAAAITIAGFDPNRAGIAVPVLTKLSFSTSSAYRVQALSTMRGLGRVARPAVPELLRRTHFGDIETRLGAAEVLVAADRSTWPTSVPIFVESLGSDSEPHRHRAIAQLREVGPNAHAGLPALRRLFKDVLPNIRVLAAEAVYRINPEEPDDAIACLVGELNPELGNGRRRFRHWRQVMAVLVKIGPAAKSAVPALLELMRQNDNEDIAPKLASTAIQLDPEQAQPAFDAFSAHLQLTNPEPDEQWLCRIVDLGKAAKPLLPNLIAALASKNEDQRSAALETLTMLGPDAMDALPALREMAKSGKEKDRARSAIEAIEGKK